MPDTSPGISALRSQRERATARPAPMHPRPIESETDGRGNSAAIPITPERAVAAPNPRPEGAEPPSRRAPVPQPRSRSKSTQGPGLAGRRRSVYLDADQEAFVHRLEMEALAAHERIGASTILRAAIDELMTSGKSWAALRPFVRHRGPAAGERGRAR